MYIRLDTAAVCLTKDQTLALTDAQGALISCQRGAVWITQDNDQRDIVLTSGESFRFDREGEAIVSALEHSAVEVLPASQPRPVGAVVRHRIERAYATAAIAPKWGAAAAAMPQ